jgi:hypothetical protein
MDPYLEERSLWPDVHQRLIAYISETLQPQVRPKYVARIGERIELAEIRKGYVPDMLIVQPPSSSARSIASAGAALADEPLTFVLMDEERRVPYIEIVYRETGDVVTLIEVISPANKVGEGRERYIQKQNDLLGTQVNLVEIDLLGEGRTPALARAAVFHNPPDWRYLVSVSRVHQRKQLEVYAIRLQDRLPRCRIPLRAADPDVVLDLPAVFARCYEVGGYDLLVDYTQAPSVTLSAAEAGWLQQRLQEQKQR